MNAACRLNHPCIAPSALAVEAARLLIPIVDPVDWGYHDRRRGWVRANTTEQLNAYYARAGANTTWFPARLTRRLIHSHLHGPDRIAVVPLRKGDFALVMIDVDAHRGQPDAHEAARYLHEKVFPGSYWEPSLRGWHAYVWFRVADLIRRAEFNVRLRMLQSDLRVLLQSSGFESTVEVMGRYTLRDRDRQIICRGDLAALPGFPRGAADLAQLRDCSTVYLPSYFKNVTQIRRKIGAIHNYEELVCGSGARVTGGCGGMDGVEQRVDVRDACEPANQNANQNNVQHQTVTTGTISDNAWTRMCWAGREFLISNGRVPGEAELLAFYQGAFHAGRAHGRRCERARSVIQYLNTRDRRRDLVGFDYHETVPTLLAAVREHCVDRIHRAGTGINDEDLAIGLYVVTRASFRTADTPRRQWTVPAASIAAMFTKLRDAGLTDRGGDRRNKIVAIKSLLARANLIECLDRRYVPAGRARGVGQKWVISVNHPRHAQFVRFAEGVVVKYVGGPTVGDARQHGATSPAQATTTPFAQPTRHFRSHAEPQPNNPGEHHED